MEFTDPVRYLAVGFCWGILLAMLQAGTDMAPLGMRHFVLFVVWSLFLLIPDVWWYEWLGRAEANALNAELDFDEDDFYYMQLAHNVTFVNIAFPPSPDDYDSGVDHGDGLWSDDGWGSN